MTATPPPPFDLESYISRYPSNSETQLQRLLFLAHQFHNDPATHDAASTAFNLAVSKLKASGNHRRYLEEYEDSSPENTSPIRIPNKESKNHVIQHYVKYDAQFVSESKSSMASQLQVLEGRLGTAQSHINKEAIRTALLALGVFLKERGDLRESWRRVVRSREYCVNGVQHWNTCLLLIELSIDLREWSNARETISRAEHTVLGDSNDPLFTHKLRAASALVALAEGRYSDSAKLFCATSLELSSQFSNVVSAEDIALYGALLGLASLDRDSLHSLVIDGAFKARLELCPSMRDALHHYSLAEYGACISILKTIVQRDILLDIHLHSHVNTLMEMIRDRCIVQYFKPYSSVSLEKMGAVFGQTVDDMEKIVAKLITKGGVEGMSLGTEARINSKDKTLSIFSSSCIERKARRRARVKAAKMGIDFMRNAEGIIMRVACLENGIVIQGNSRRNQSGRVADTAERLVSDGMAMDAPGDSDSSVISQDPMEVEKYDVANPNDFD